MAEPARRIPRRASAIVILIAAALIVLIEVLRPGSFLRSFWSESPQLDRTPAQSVREGFEGRRPRRPRAPDQD